MLHGPPGTGKTTVLVKSIIELLLAGKKILVASASNPGVDNIAVINKHLFMITF